MWFFHPTDEMLGKKMSSQFTPLPTPQEARLYGGEQICALHLNGLCVVTLSAEHPIIKENLKVERVDFEVGKSAKKGESRLEAVKTKGKRKRGGVSTRHETVVCDAYVQGERRFRIHANVTGTMIELNEELIQNPDLLRTSYAENGWLGIVVPIPSEKTRLEQLLREKGLETSNMMLGETDF